MLSQEENDLLTRTGPGTPGGALLRRYWQPVALAEELPANGAPLPVRIMSEDLVLFRDDQGQLGLIGLHCSHRRADLSYGRVENGGLRCLYHGWLYDRHGKCLEQPCEPPEKRFCEKVHHPAYPCHEQAGIIFAYMGPGEAPLFPAYEPFLAPSGHVLVTKIFHECNYFQANEGNLDPSHVSYLHRQANVPQNLKRPVEGSDGKLPLALYEADMAPEIDVEETDYGVRIFSTRDTDNGRTFFRVTNFVLPNKATIPGPMSGDGYNLYWHVPIDDTHHWRYDIVFRRSAPMEEKDIREKPGNPRRADARLPAETQQGQPLSAGPRIDEDVELLRDGTDLQRAGYRHRRRQRPDRRPHPGIPRPQRQSDYRRAPPSLACDPRRRGRP